MKSLKKKATFENLNYFLGYIELFVKENGFNEEFLNDISLVVEELLVNIISYAFPNIPAGEMELSLSVLNKTVKIEIVDGGIPFNILEAKAPDTNLPLVEREIGGMGIHLVKNLVDKIQYERKDEKNFLTLFKG